MNRSLRRLPRVYPPHSYVTEGNVQVAIGKKNYFLSADGLLMPAKKNQTPPDLRYFKQTQQ
jgi:hypothetical protein